MVRKYYVVQRRTTYQVELDGERGGRAVVVLPAAPTISRTVGSLAGQGEGLVQPVSELQDVQEMTKYQVDPASYQAYSDMSKLLLLAFHALFLGRTPQNTQDNQYVRRVPW